MKKIIALLLAVLMVLSMVACASKTTDDTAKTDDTATTDTTDTTTDTADDKTDDTAESEDKTEEPAETDGSDYAVAMITDYGDITDQSFNQTTYEACKAFCEANGIDFNYFKPAGDNTADRVAMIEKAVD